jgi:hypothetical protein
MSYLFALETRDGSGLLYNTSGTIAVETTAATTLYTTAPAVASADLIVDRKNLESSNRCIRRCCCNS